MSTHTQSTEPTEPEQGPGCPGVGITGSCELLWALENELRFSARAVYTLYC